MAQKTRIFSRPKGAPMSAATEITDLPKSEQERISMVNAIAGKQLEQEKMALDVEAAKTKALGLNGAGTTQKTPTPAPESSIQPKVSPEDMAKTMQTLAAQKAAPEGSKAQQTWEAVTGVSPEAVKEADLWKPSTLVAPLAKTALNYYQNIKALTGIGGRDTSKVAGLKDNYNQAVGSIDKEITLVQTGAISDFEVSKHIQEAYDANAEIAQAAKEKGMHNLAYWLQEGKSLEILAQNNMRDLQILLVKLEAAKMASVNAEAEQQRQQALQNYG